MRILITGGHITPALAVIEELQKKNGVQLIFVGRKYVEGTISLEYKEIEKLRIPFISLQAGRLTRLASPSSFNNLIKVPFGFLQALAIVAKEKPDALLTFGGYIGLPLAYAARFFRIPVYTHEQTLRPGLANIWIARLAKKIFVSFKETEKFFPSGKAILTGNPIRRAIFEVRNKPFVVPADKQIIYVTGGSLGSHSINMHIKDILSSLLKKYVVIHQTGDTKKYKDFEELSKTRESLEKKLKENYFLKKHFLEEEVGYVYSLANIVVSRAGANTFFELLALEKPVIFIPLPWSAYQEQQKQAEIFASQRIGEVFNQSSSSHQLLILIEKVLKQKDIYHKNFHKLKFLYKENAAEKIAKEILFD